MQNQEIKSMITEILGSKSKINACRLAFLDGKIYILINFIDKRKKMTEI